MESALLALLAMSDRRPPSCYCPSLVTRWKQSLTWDDACDRVEEGLQVATNQKPTFLFLPSLPNIVLSLWQPSTAAGTWQSLELSAAVPDEVRHASRLQSNAELVLCHRARHKQASSGSSTASHKQNRVTTWSIGRFPAPSGDYWGICRPFPPSRPIRRETERRGGSGIRILAALAWYFLVLCLITSIFMSHSEVISSEANITN